MHPEQKTSIEVSKDGVKFQVPNQDNYTGTIITGGVVILIIFAIALLRWGPEKFKGFFKKGNGNSKKAEVSNVAAPKSTADAVQDQRLLAIEENHKDLRQDMRDLQAGQNTIIEKQGAIGAKIDIILAKV